MRSVRCATLLFALLSPTSAPTQSTYVSPGYFKTHEGPGKTSYPFARAGSTKTMHYLELHDLGQSFSKRLFALASRRDRSHPFQADTVPAWWTEVEIALSTSPTNSARMSTTFHLNEGMDRKVVVKRKKVNFSSYSLVGKGPQPFFYVIPFDAGGLFRFGGGSLAVDIKVHDNNAVEIVKQIGGYWYFDVANNSGDTSMVDIGTGCTSSGGFPRATLQVQWSNFSSAQNKLSYRSIVYYGPRGANIPGLQMFSAALLPGTGISFPGGCRLYLDPATIFATLPGKPLSGGGTFGFPPYKTSSPEYMVIPWHANMKGAVVFAQTFLPDATANSFGVVSSNAVQLTLPSYNPFGYTVSNLQDTSLTATTGRIYRDTGLVTQFQGL